MSESVSARPLVYTLGDRVMIYDARQYGHSATISAVVIVDVPASYYRLRLDGYTRFHHAWIPNPVSEAAKGLLPRS